MNKRILQDRAYQKRCIDQIMDFLNAGASKVLLGAAPNSGKTEMSYEVIRQFDKKKKRVLVLAHLTNSLLDNYTERETPFAFDKFGTAEDATLDPKALKTNVLISLPVNIANLKPSDLKQFDIIVVDEAHEGLVGKGLKNFKKILKMFGKRAQFLYLTGSPFVFNHDKDIQKVYVTAWELIEGGFSIKPIISIATANYSIKNSDLTDDGDVKTTHHKVVFTHKANKQAIEMVIDRLIDRLHKTDMGEAYYKNSSKIKVPKADPKVKALLKSAKAGLKEAKSVYTDYKLVEKLGKTMIACESIDQAVDVAEICTAKGFKTLLSHSDENRFGDEDSQRMKQFQRDHSVQILVVVDRGVLGYNVPELQNFVDMTMSENPSRIWQMVCRVTRQYDDMEKLFMKVVQNDEQRLYKSRVCMTIVWQVACIPEFYQKWDGRLRSMTNLVAKKRKRKEGGDKGTCTAKPGPGKFVDEDILDPLFMESWEDATGLKIGEPLSEHIWARFDRINHSHGYQDRILDPDDKKDTLRRLKALGISQAKLVSDHSPSYETLKKYANVETDLDFFLEMATEPNPYLIKDRSSERRKRLEQEIELFENSGKRLPKSDLSKNLSFHPDLQLRLDEAIVKHETETRRTDLQVRIARNKFERFEGRIPLFKDQNSDRDYITRLIYNKEKLENSEVARLRADWELAIEANLIKGAASRKISKSEIECRLVQMVERAERDGSKAAAFVNGGQNRMFFSENIKDYPELLARYQALSSHGPKMKKTPKKVTKEIQMEESSDGFFVIQG